MLFLKTIYNKMAFLVTPSLKQEVYYLFMHPQKPLTSRKYSKDWWHLFSSRSGAGNSGTSTLFLHTCLWFFNSHYRLSWRERSVPSHNILFMLGWKLTEGKREGKHGTCSQLWFSGIKSFEGERKGQSFSQGLMLAPHACLISWVITLLDSWEGKWRQSVWWRSYHYPCALGDQVIGPGLGCKGCVWLGCSFLTKTCRRT